MHTFYQRLRVRCGGMPRGSPGRYWELALRAKKAVVEKGAGYAKLEIKCSELQARAPRMRVSSAPPMRAREYP